MEHAATKLLQSMHLPELKTLGADFGLCFSTRVTKAQVIRLLVAEILTPHGRVRAMRRCWFAAQLFPQALAVHPLEACLCQLRGSADLIECSTCQQLQHQSCMHRLGLRHYVCPSCQLAQVHILDAFVEFVCPPFQVLRANACAVAFDLSEVQAARLQQETGEVQVRCLKLGTERFVHAWPRHGLLFIDGKVAMEFCASPSSPLNITRLLGVGRHHINLFSLDTAELYVCAVALVKPLTNQQVKNQLTSFTEAQSTAIRHRTFAVKNSQVLLQSVRISLKCPSSSQLIDCPVRGAYCKHIQCFNLMPFLDAQRVFTPKRWRCPICGKPCVILKEDLTIKALVKLAATYEGVEGAEFFVDGSCRLYRYQNRRTNGKTRDNPIILY